MAIVYLARDPAGRAFALKALRPELAVLLGNDRFLREIEIARRLDHPNIMPLLDSGEAAGLPWYVMPLAEGESLRDRLTRERELPLADALRIALEVAAALGHAHEHKIVHRDIKPDNILFDRGCAVVADFGIARAVMKAAPGAALTTSGFTLGTPTYMSPEQASATGEVDGRSDLYSLACVLYEMLAGMPPFTGPNSQAVLARHQLDDVPPIRTVRRSVPEALEKVIVRALSKSPADRYQNAAHFAAALTEAAASMTVRRRPVALILGIAAVGLAALTFARGRVVAPGSDPGAADTTRWVVFPAGSSGDYLDEAERLRDALLRWDGITLVDGFQVRDALAQRGTGALPATPSEARRIAARLGAGRFVLTEVSRFGDSARLRAVLFDATRTGAPLAEASLRTAGEDAGSDSAWARLGDRLLFGEAPASARARLTGTRSLPARQALARGHAAILEWNLAAAESAFSAAGDFDPGYAEALLWLALSRWWAERPTAAWRSAAERALGLSASLAVQDSLVAVGLVEAGRDPADRTCAMFERLAARNRHDFAAWYSLATCLRSDNIVVPDARSPSGWRFRSSYHHAMHAYRQALSLLPSIHKSLGANGFQRVRNRLFIVSARYIVAGRAAPPDTSTFWAYATMQGDTLVFIPQRPTDVTSGRVPVAPSRGAALLSQLALFRDIASGWVAAYPRSPDAMEALGLSLAFLGDPASVDTLRRARALAGRSPQATWLAATEVFTRLKFATPHDLPGIDGARSLADSLLRLHRPAAGMPEPLLLASLAALLGRARLAADYSRMPDALAQRGIDGQLAAFAPALLTFAALGGPADSLDRLISLAVRVVSTSYAGRAMVRQRWIARPVTLAAPRHTFRPPPDVTGTGYHLADALAAHQRGDAAAVRSILDGVARARAHSRAADLSLDAVYPEAWLLATIGDTAGAAAWLDPPLGELAYMAPRSFSDPAEVASLVHAMALRAELASALGDRAGAQAWSAVVARLWSDSDEFLRPVVERMRALSR
jgi:hypothetical protein